MTTKHDAIVLSKRLLAAMAEVNPPLEKLMAERFSLRQEIRAAESALKEAQNEVAGLRRLRNVQIPRYIGIAKVLALTVPTLGVGTLAAGVLAYLLGFANLLLLPQAPLMLSLLIPIVLVDLAEARFGRWHLHFGRLPTFAFADREVVAP